MLSVRKSLTFYMKKALLRAERVIEEANKVSEEHKRLVRARRRLHYTIRRWHDRDNDDPIFTAEG